MSYSQGTRTKPKFRPQKINETTESKVTNNDVQRPKYASKTDPRKKNEEILFGFYPVLMALKQGTREFQKIYYNESSVKTKEIVDLAVQKGVTTKLVSAQTLDNLAKLSTTEFTSHQGICALVGKLQMSSEFIENVKAFAILLCGIGHPQNIGAILRSSYYLGVDRVYTTNCKFIDSNGNSILKSSAPLTPSVSKASSGVLEIFQPTHLNDPEKFVEFVKSRGWIVIGSGIQKQGAILKNNISTQSEDSVNTNKPGCHQKPQLLVIGNEGFGIPQKNW